MTIFITGAGGYIGGSVAVGLVGEGHAVTGLIRRREQAEPLKRLGITPIVGDLDDAELLTEAATAADVVIHAASADHAASIHTLVGALRGTGKRLIHTSGSSIIGDKAAGEPSDIIVSDDSLSEPREEKATRVAIDRMVLQSANDGVHAIVICPTMVYGVGRGLHRESIQIPMLVRHGRATDTVRYIGRGLNRWANVHIDDLCTLYSAALMKAPAGTFFFAEHGEESLNAIADAIARRVTPGRDAQSFSEEEAIAVWGFEAAVFALGSNSRARAVNAHRLLDWRPRHDSLLQSIATD
jgi:nucleoside-diphosphate-sugar epimerase